MEILVFIRQSISVFKPFSTLAFGWKIQKQIAKKALQKAKREDIAKSRYEHELPGNLEPVRNLQTC